MTDTLDLPGLAGSRDDAAAGMRNGEVPLPAARVIGLDPSLTATGMSDGQTTWVIRTSAQEDPTLADRAARLRGIAKEVCARIPADTQLVLIEGPAPDQTTGHKHDRSGAWWLIVSALTAAKVEVVEVTPGSLKKYATGNGNSRKALVVDAATRRYPEIVTNADDNRADALWLAAMGVDHFTGVHVVPEAHRVALKAVRWPL